MSRYEAGDSLRQSGHFYLMKIRLGNIGNDAVAIAHQQFFMEAGEEANLNG